MANKIAQGSALGLHYEIYDRTGVVDQSDTRSETQVEGSVSGGGSYGGYTAPVVGSVSSTTTRYQNIFLTDDEGKEHVIELQNFLVPVRAGQRLTIFLLTHGKHDFGSYFKAFNRNTKEIFNHPKAIRSEMYPWRTFLILLGVMILLIFFNVNGEQGTSFVEALFYTGIGSLIVGAPLWLIGWVVSYVRALAVSRNPDFKAYVGCLRQGQEICQPHFEGSAHA